MKKEKRIKEEFIMKRFALILALVLLLTACAEVPPPADTAPPQTTAPVETTVPVETTLPVETTVPAETTAPAPVAMTVEEAAALLDYGTDPNWLARTLGCLFESPTELDLYYMFYLGVVHPGSWNDICEASRQSLVDQGFLEEFDLQIMPAEKLEAALRETFGIGLADVTIPESWCYIEAENAYCSNHSDAYFPGVPIITAVEDDGQFITIRYTIDGYWVPATDEFLDTAHLVLSLKRTKDGSIIAVSNLLES